MDYKKMNMDDIIAWCVKNNQVEWLKEESVKNFKTKEDIDRRITFIELKRDFCEEFMPEILPEKKEKEPTMFEKIAAL